MRKLTFLFVLVGLFSFSFGQGIGFKAIGPKLGAIFPEDPWSTGFLVGVDVDLGELTENLHLVPNAAYWSSKYDWDGSDLTLSNIQIGADVHYFLPSVQGLFIGGGLGLNILSVDVPEYRYYDPYSGTYTTTGGGSDSETKIGFGALAGYQMPIGNMTGFAKAKYNIISDLNTFELVVGVMFDMAK